MSSPAHYKKILPIIQAFSEGKVVQWRYPNGSWNTSHTASRLAFEDPTITWRIKPDPRVLWVHKNTGFTRHAAPGVGTESTYVKYVEEISDGE